MIPGPPFSFNNVRELGTGFIQPNQQSVCQSMLATVHQMHHAHDTSTKAKLAEYHHQSLFSPPPPTLVKAIQNKQLESFSGLTGDLIRKHQPKSTATLKGHMHCNRKGQRSTHSNAQAMKDAMTVLEDMHPTEQLCTS